MAGGFESCIHDAVFRGEIEKEDADEVLEQFAADMVRGFTRGEAKQRAADALRVRGNQKVLNITAMDGITKHLAEHKDVHGRPDGIEAGKSLWEDFGWGGHENVRSLAEANATQTFAKAAEALDFFRRGALPRGKAVLGGGRMNKGKIGELLKAAYGEPGVDPQIQKFAEDILAACNDQRLLRNRLSGEEVPMLRGWWPRTYNENAIYNMGTEGMLAGQHNSTEALKRFRDLFDPELDWPRMYDPYTKKVFGKMPPEAYRMEILKKAKENMTVGKEREPVSYRIGTGGFSRDYHRYFLFKNAEAEMRVMRQVGDGDLLSSFIEHTMAMANENGLLKVFGPNVSGNIEFTKQSIMEDAKKRAKETDETLPQDKSKFMQKYSSGNVMDKAAFGNLVIDGFYSQYRGDGINPTPLALTARILEENAYGALMGSAVVTHIAANPMIQMQVRHLAGVPVMRTIPRLIQAFGPNARKEMLRSSISMQEGARVVAQSAKMDRTLSKMAKWWQWWPDRVVHHSFLSAFLNAFRRSYAFDHAAMIADLKKYDWANIPQRQKDMMQGYGLREPDWKLIQMSENYQPLIWSAPWQRADEVMDVALRNPRAVLDLFGRDDPNPTRLNLLPGEVSPQAKRSPMRSPTIRGGSSTE